MSGIVGILNLNNGPVDTDALKQMTGFLCYRGPSMQRLWTSGPLGLGHAQLHLTSKFAAEHPPVSLDGHTWIIADARIDARSELIVKLQAAGCNASESNANCELILQAYAVWGENCVKHVIGDFIFAIWDGVARKLFCARDRFGIKPFFYARVGRWLVFTNTLDCLRVHPDVSSELNDSAVADFLLFDLIQKSDVTIFRDIQRLPAAHALICSGGTPRVQRYWELPVEGALVYRRGSEYVEQFWELLSSAVKDRMPTEGAGILMSGGLDSTIVAAVAKDLLMETAPSGELRAYTQVFDRIVHHEERRYATLAAERLHIPIEFQVQDDYRLYEGSDHPENRVPEPSIHPMIGAERDLLRKVAGRHRVLLTGLGADPALSTSLSFYGRTLLGERHFGRLVREFVGYFFTQGRLRRLYFKKRLRILTQRNPWRSMFPPWLNPEFAKRLDLPARWAEQNQPKPVASCLRPSARLALASPAWPVLFESCDAGTTRVHLELRHPFFDLRLLRFLLRVPALPWASDKQLLREAGRGRLPEQVRLRRKTPLENDPVLPAVKRVDLRPLDALLPAPELGRYVDWERVPRLTGNERMGEVWAGLRPRALNVWFRAGFRTPRTSLDPTESAPVHIHKERDLPTRSTQFI